MSSKFTPFTSPTVIPNSGSKKFSAQSATIYKINFFKQQNEEEFYNFKTSTNYTGTTPILPDSNFPNQQTTQPTNYVYKKYPEC